MWFFTCIALFVLMYLLIELIVPLFFDCDLKLAWAERFGKPIDSLAGKVVWITGASSGIGKHLALALAPAGVKLVLSARREQELEKVKEECLIIGKILASDVLVLPMDVTEEDKHKALFKRVLDCFGHLDILVNNAGRSQRANWEDIDVNVDREMFELNVFGVLSLSRLVVQHFLDKKQEGHIVVTSSLAGVLPAPFSASYTGAKHAIHGYFNALRLEKMQTNISVTLLCPGPVFTDFLAESFTAKPGEKFGKPVESTDRRMTAERCGVLCAVAIANKLEEAWIALPPIVTMVQLFCFYPNFRHYFNRFLGPKFFLKLRDTKIKMETKSA